MSSNVMEMFETTAKNLVAMAQSGYVSRIGEAVALIADAFGRGNKLLVMGNGGSAADAQHICAELVGKFTLERRGLPAIALTANQSIVTAWGNDYSFDTVFSRQVEAFGATGDVVWGISTSGNSPNVVEAMKRAKELGMPTIGLTGEGGGRMGPFCDVLLAAPLRETPRIQEVHLVTYHAICAQVEERLFGNVGTL